MACCILTAYCMFKLIQACEILDISIIKTQYNAFHDGPEGFADAEKQVQSRKLVTTKLSLDGLSCAACVSSIEAAVSSLSGVVRISVSLPLSRATIVHDESQVSVDEILSTIESQGYGAKVGERTAREALECLQHKEEIETLRKAFSHAALLSSAISGLEMLLWLRLPRAAVICVNLIVASIAIWVQCSDAMIIHHNAWRRGVAASMTMDSLVSLSLAFGTALSILNMLLFGPVDAKVYWPSISFLSTVILGGRLLDMILRKQSTSTFASLYQLQEKCMYATLIRSIERKIDQEQLVDAATLQVGDEIRIAPGFIIPCDSYVSAGESLVDQATMTGESIPVQKKPGDLLMAGTSNLSYDLNAVVLKPQEESALENLVASVSEATETSATNDEADMLISRFAQGILLLTGLCFWWTLSSGWHGGNVLFASNKACERAMAILASACPCALGLATPTAVIAGLDACQSRGMIVKGGIETLRTIAKLTHMVLDKTGTLTTGQLSVSDAEGKISALTRILICVAEQNEAQTHPVAHAVFRWAYSLLTAEERQLVVQSRATKILNNPGSGNGVRYEVLLAQDDIPHSVLLGNEEFMRSSEVPVCYARQKPCETSLSTSVYVAIDGAHTGVLQLQDTVRRDAPAVVGHLKHKVGLEVCMLTGDVQSEASRVARMLKIDVLSSHALPAEKKSFVQHLQERSPTHRIAMMGDGLNDAPALAAADVGIALNLGSKHAAAQVAEATNAQTSEVIFTSPELTRLPELVDIARKTVQQSRWNFRWAIAYNTVAVSLAMGMMEPWGLRVDAARAGTMMALSSISVLAFSLWLRHDLSKVAFSAAVEPLVTEMKSV